MMIVKNPCSGKYIQIENSMEKLNEYDVCTKYPMNFDFVEFFDKCSLKLLEQWGPVNLPPEQKAEIVCEIAKAMVLERERILTSFIQVEKDNELDLK